MPPNEEFTSPNEELISLPPDPEAPQTKEEAIDRMEKIKHDVKKDLTGLAEKLWPSDDQTILNKIGEGINKGLRKVNEGVNIGVSKVSEGLRLGGEKATPETPDNPASLIGKGANKLAQGINVGLNKVTEGMIQGANKLNEMANTEVTEVKVKRKRKSNEDASATDRATERLQHRQNARGTDVVLTSTGKKGGVSATDRATERLLDNQKSNKEKQSATDRATDRLNAREAKMAEERRLKKTQATDVPTNSGAPNREFTSPLAVESPEPVVTPVATSGAENPVETPTVVAQKPMDLTPTSSKAPASVPPSGKRGERVKAATEFSTEVQKELVRAIEKDDRATIKAIDDKLSEYRYRDVMFGAPKGQKYAEEGKVNGGPIRTEFKGEALRQRKETFINELLGEGITREQLVKLSQLAPEPGALKKRSLRYAAEQGIVRFDTARKAA